jgi:hypothetical protein
MVRQVLPAFAENPAGVIVHSCLASYHHRAAMVR